jgi:hypothetical protein
MAVDLEEEFGPFGQPQGAAELAVTLIERHFAVQAGKPPKGKQPWFDDAGQGWVVRTPYRLGERQERRDYLHPYRARAVAQFMADTE